MKRKIATDAELYERACGGDTRAVLGLLSRHTSALRDYIEREVRYLRRTGARGVGGPAVDRILSLALLIAANELDRKPEGVRVHSWLRHLALRAVDRYSEAATQARDNGPLSLEEVLSRTPEGEDLFEFYQPDQLLTREDETPDSESPEPDKLESAIERLEPDERRVAVLCVLGSMSVEEVAALEQRTEAEVQQLLTHAKRHLMAAADRA